MANSSYGVFNTHVPTTAENCVKDRTPSAESFGAVVGAYSGGAIGVLGGPATTVAGMAIGAFVGNRVMVSVMKDKCAQEFPQLRK